MTDTRWQTLFEEARAVHAGHPDVAAFCEFPSDVSASTVEPHRIGAAELLEAETELGGDAHAAFRDAFVACSPLAPWRETYRGTNIGEDFLSRFGCYELIGFDGAFSCTTMRSFVVYAPAGLHYPWHHHPAEELYLVLGGEAEFHLEGEPSRTLRAGDTAFHPSNRPHAMTTHEHPVMAYVLWRSDLNIAPVLTEGLA